MVLRRIEATNIGEYQDRKAGVGLLVSRGKGDGIGYFSEGKPGKEITFEK